MCVCSLFGGTQRGRTSASGNLWTIDGQNDSIVEPGEFKVARFVEIVAAVIYVAQIGSCVKPLHSVTFPSFGS